MQTVDAIPYSDTESETNNEWTFENVNLEESEDSIVVVPEPIPQDTERHRQDDDARMHFSRYKTQLIASKNSNLIRINVNIGDLVLVKKDFDNNVKTKRTPFESFFSEHSYRVVDLLSNNMIKLQDTVNDEIIHVFKGSIKKI